MKLLAWIGALICASCGQHRDHSKITVAFDSDEPAKVYAVSCPSSGHTPTNKQIVAGKCPKLTE